MLTAEQQEACLSDISINGNRVMSDEIVVCHSENYCYECGSKTEPGTHVRVRIENDKGNRRTLVTCEDCCVGIAAMMKGDRMPFIKHIQRVKRDMRMCEDMGE